MIQQHKPDVIFLDIEMPRMNGFRMLDEVGHADFEIVFTTAYNHYAVDAIRISAFDYLTKPIALKDLQKTVERLSQRTRSYTKDKMETLRTSLAPTKSQEEKLAVPTGDGLEFIPIRNIIHIESSSNYSKISVSYTHLDVYKRQEQLRFNNKFKYETCIDPELLNGDYRLPSLLIQPYVENAIVHGLAHSEEPYLYLLLTATLENDRIKFIVEDNGVGRKQAGIYNEQNKPGHKSTGLKITEDRINIFNADSAINNPVKFTEDVYKRQFLILKRAMCK